MTASPADVHASITAAPSLAQSALRDLTRMVALAMQDQGLRQHIKHDLRASHHTREHKLAFSDYLHGNGGILLAKMAKAAGETHEQVLTLLRALPPLEFYMPVAAHRATWIGGDNIIVASQLVEGDAPVGFRTDGSSVELAVAAPPATPVLVIVPAETDFSTELPDSMWRDSDDQGGQAVGTLMRVGSRAQPSRTKTSTVPPGVSLSIVGGDGSCDPTTAIIPCDDGGGSPPPAVYPAGVYLDHTHLGKLGEDWPRGDPEIELFVIGPTFNPGSNGEKISCSGEHAGSIKHYDQNSLDFQAAWWSVQAQILSMVDVAHYQEIYNAPYSLQLWEDDNAGCDIVFNDRSQLDELVDNLRAAGRATSMIIGIISGSIHINGGTITALYNQVAGIFASEDDPLGHVVLMPGTTQTLANGDSYVDGDLVLPDMATNGTVRIRSVNVAHD